ncbi:hypothetical protein Y032_0433g1375 [Ancylostoma ceylanicum]|uniref:AAA+ ATPase domain-containing protein n=1 Tax=Ancylostoma ceylanicum TaxID=53326 RepID=A0A016X027_9BILA|nr:hypothetical protein Y032_0433g1375 [Ancylostoma ceylanicum]
MGWRAAMVQTRRSLLISQANSSTPKQRTASRSSSITATTSTTPHRMQENGTKTKRKQQNAKPRRASKNHVKPLIGREREFSTICEWVEKALADGQPLSVYISGSPGTGKSATMSLVLKHFGHQVLSATLNCASLHSESEMIKSILGNMKSSLRPSLAALSSTLKALRKHFVLVLDEIDHLASKTNSFLYTTFQWPHTISSNLIVIGIANSIDLTERLLPKLKLSHPPQTLVFAPYSKEAIAEILKDKMSTESDDAMDAKALELCSRKVAAMSGDLRAALHVIKHTSAAVKQR